MGIITLLLSNTPKYLAATARSHISIVPSGHWAAQERMIEQTRGRSTHGGQRECTDGYGDFPANAGRQIICEKLSFVCYRRELFKGGISENDQKELSDHEILSDETFENYIIGYST